MAIPDPAPQPDPVARLPFRALDLRPRWGLAGSRSYYRCALSPDERLVAVAVRSLRYDDVGNAAPAHNVLPTGAPREVAGGEVWIVPLTGGETRVLTPGWGTSWGPCWSPDGRRLAFYSDRDGAPQIWLWDRESGATRRASDLPVVIRFGLEGMRWLPDGRRLVVKLRPPDWRPPSGDPGPLAKGRRDVWRSPLDERSLESQEEGLRYLDLHRGDVAVLDVETGAATILETGVEPRGLAVSPDGRFVAALCSRDEPPEGQNLNELPFDLHLFAADGSLGRVLAERIPQSYGIDFSWSPGGDALAYVAQPAAPGGPSRLVVVDLGGRERCAWEGGGDAGDGVSFGRDERMAPPLWAPDGRTLYACGERAGQGTVYAVRLSETDGAVRDLGERLGKDVTGVVFRPGAGAVPELGQPGTLVVVTRDPHTSRAGLFRLDGQGEGEPAAVVPERGGGLRDIPHTGDVGHRWIVAPVGDDLHAIDAETGAERRLTDLNAHLRRLPRMTSHLIPMSGLQEEPLRAAVWLPAGYAPGRRYPVVVGLYLGRRAGPSADDPQKLLLTARGYLVVEPDMPHVPDVGPADAATRYALLALEAAVAQGLADPERAALLGHSAGGYDVCCVVTRTDRFRAAVAAAPFADLVSYALQLTAGRLSSAGQVEGGHARLGGTLWEQRERYVENSPVFHLDRVTTPLLLLCGAVDSLLPQAEEVFAGLLRQGQTAELVRYHGEGHVPFNSWSDQNFDDYWARTLDWLDRHLTTPPAA